MEIASVLNNARDLLKETSREVTTENQNGFLQTTIGKVINSGLNLGLRALLPDLIEDQVIRNKRRTVKWRDKGGNKYSNSICNRSWKECNRTIYRKI